MSNRVYISRLIVGFIAAFILMGVVKSVPTNDVRGARVWWDLKDARFDAMVSDGPRIVFAGGSATLFGLSAERFTALSGVPSFNFGLHANFGQSVLVDAALAKAKKGDLLVWSPELSGLTGAFPTIAIYAHPWEPSLNAIWGLVTHWFKTPPDLIARWPAPIPEGSVYHVDAIGAYGDQRRNIGRVSDSLCLLGEPAPIDWVLIDEILARVESKGVTLVFRFPTIADLACNRWIDASVEALDAGLIARGVTVFNRTTMRRPIEDFHDTHYHLNQVGAEHATRGLISQLRESKLLPLRGPYE